MPQNNKFDAVGEFRKRFPALAGTPDVEIARKLMNPVTFRDVFPEFDVTDNDIKKNMGTTVLGLEKSAAQPAAQPDNRSTAKKAWDTANTSVLDMGMHKLGLSTPKESAQLLRDDATSAPTAFGAKHPWLAAMGRGLEGTAADVMDVANGMYTPLSLATMSAGPAANSLSKASKAAGTMGKVAKVAAPAARWLNRGINAGMAVEGGYNTVKGAGNVMDDLSRDPFSLNTVQDIANTGLGAIQTFGGVHGTTEGLFHDRMQQPYIGDNGLPVTKPFRTTEKPMSRLEVYNKRVKAGMNPDLADTTQIGPLQGAKEYLSGSIAGRGAFADNAVVNKQAHMGALDKAVQVEKDLNAANNEFMARRGRMAEAIKNNDEVAAATLMAEKPAFDKKFASASRKAQSALDAMKLTSSSDSWLPKAAPPIEILGTGALAYLHHPLSAAAVPVGEWALSKAMTSKPVVGHLIDQVAPAAQANRGALLSGTHAWLKQQ